MCVMGRLHGGHAGRDRNTSRIENGLRVENTKLALVPGFVLSCGWPLELRLPCACSGKRKAPAETAEPFLPRCEVSAGRPVGRGGRGGRGVYSAGSVGVQRTPLGHAPVGGVPV